MEKVEKFISTYINSLSSSIMNSDMEKLHKAAMQILQTIKKDATIYVCGNGGSAAIANHYVVDFLKFFREKTIYKPKIVSFSNNIETITAISNDIKYKFVFKYQAENFCKKNDLIIIVSSSGNSENIIELLKFTKKNKITTIGFSGFKGGYLKRNSDISVHINAENYGISEDAHHILMHAQLQYLIKYFSGKN
jgi:phosphoheptose isomerase